MTFRLERDDGTTTSASFKFSPYKHESQYPNLKVADITNNNNYNISREISEI